MLTPRERLIAALRSGDFQQGKYALHQNDKFCCMGVACEVAIADGVPVEVGRVAGLVTYDGQDSVLPNDVRAHFGFSSLSGAYKGSTLVMDNDSGATFTEIADLIESNPAGMFLDKSGRGE